MSRRTGRCAPHTVAVHPADPEQYRIPPTPAPPGYPHPYAAPGYPPPGYPPPGYPVPYGAAPWNAPRVSAAWPHGPGRPGIATAAAVLGFVTGGLTALGSFFFLLAVLFGDGDLPTGLLAFGLLCAPGLIRGGVLVLRRHSTTMLIGSSIAAVAVLLLALAAGVADLDSAGLMGLGLFVVLAAVLPVVTAALAATGTVRGWMEWLR
jgi:hypothetical protein